MPRAIVLLSGGLDSATCLAIAQQEGFQCYALSFDYGQRHRLEIERAAAIARSCGCLAHRVVHIDFPASGASALTSKEIAVPKDSLDPSVIPVTYVPARNMIFLAYAVAWGESLGVGDIFIGANALDYSGYPDCRPAFLEAFQTAANLATRVGEEGTLQFRIHHPLLWLTKAEIIRRGLTLGVDYARTLFGEIGLPDPLLG
jgi:7-cyano-7-deazaguanine synthase